MSDSMFVGGSLSDAALPLAGSALILAGWAIALVVHRVRRPSRTARPDDAVLRVHRLAKSYGERRALDDVTLAVPRGAVLALLGPNGAGKTTLLRAITGLSQPSSGASYLMGELVTPGAPILRRVGVALEEPGFAPQLTGRANLEFLWRAGGGRLADAHLELAAELAGLTPYLDRRAGDYSQGMKQRLAVAGALLGLPDLLLLDEPTNGLDPAQTRELGATLARYAASGRTVVLASHHLAEVDNLCSHVLVLDEARVRWFGSVDEVARTTSRVRVGLDDPAAALARLTADARWRRLDPPVAVHCETDSLHIELRGNQLGDVLAAISAAGVGVRSVHTDNRLGDLYRRMTTDVAL